MGFNKVGTLQSSVLSFLTNTHTSNEDLKNIIKTFEDLDKDNSGTISIHELQESIKTSKVFQGLSPAELDQMIAKLDANRDGQVDFTEFVTAAYDRQKILNRDNIKIAFDLFDIDKNGFITKEELQSVFGAQLTSPKAVKEFEAQWAQILKECDASNDANISFDEFANAMQTVLRDE
jgi:calcium-dependent protein kinase